jgi:hypothetical protein
VSAGIHATSEVIGELDAVQARIGQVLQEQVEMRRRSTPDAEPGAQASGLGPRASRRICAAGRGRLGALGAEKPDRLCVPSQKGLIPDFPHRHSAIVSRPGSISTPSWSTSRKSPRTISGPSR